MPRPTIVYSGTDEEKRTKALEDCKSYLGEESFDRILTAFRTEGKDYTVDQLCFQLAMFVGIEGFPARVFAEYSKEEL